MSVHVKELFSKSKLSLTKIDLTDLNRFRYELSQKNLDIKTVNAYMVTLRSFFKYAKKQGYEVVDFSAIELNKQPDRKVEFLTSDEMKSLFEAINTSSIQGLRDLAITECIYSTGLRISELVALNRTDISLERGEFAVRGK